MLEFIDVYCCCLFPTKIKRHFYLLQQRTRVWFCRASPGGAYLCRSLAATDTPPSSRPDLGRTRTRLAVGFLRRTAAAGSCLWSCLLRSPEPDVFKDQRANATAKKNILLVFVANPLWRKALKARSKRGRCFRAVAKEFTFSVKTAKLT